jgi:hypothetical protein
MEEARPHFPIINSTNLSKYYLVTSIYNVIIFWQHHPYLKPTLRAVYSLKGYISDRWMAIVTAVVLFKLAVFGS